MVSNQNWKEKLKNDDHFPKINSIQSPNKGPSPSTLSSSPLSQRSPLISPSTNKYDLIHIDHCIYNRI